MQQRTTEVHGPFIEPQRHKSLIFIRAWGMDASGQTELNRRLFWIPRLHLESRGSASSRSLCALPSFFIIGPPRTGTSWLYEVMRQHTLLPWPTKETRFFDSHFHKGLDWYRSHYPVAVNERRIGEVAPTYFASASAMDRIANTIPDAKVVCIFRHPVERVVSLYKVKRAYGLIPWNFEEAMIRDPEMLQSSRYASRLKAWQDTFGQGQVLATVYDDLCRDPQTFVDQIADFIGATRFPLTMSQRFRIHASEGMTHPWSYHTTRGASSIADWCKAHRLDRLVAAIRNSPLKRIFLGGGSPFQDVPEQVLAKVSKLFDPEVDELEILLQRNLSEWRTAD